MDPTRPSVFDLSDSEKLQLVQDLWDDLSATSESIPFQEWQKEELAARKAKWLENPALGLDWDTAKRLIRERHPAAGV